jgi:hypothetical protein
MPQYVLIKSYASPGGTPFVLNVAGAVSAADTDVVLYAQATLAHFSQNELWLITSDGYIVSAMSEEGSPQLVLGISPNDEYGWPGVAVVSYAAGDESQQWTMEAEGTLVGDSPVTQIVNVKSGLSLNVAGGNIANGSVIITYTQCDDAGSLWTIEPYGVPFNQGTPIASAFSTSGDTIMGLSVTGAGTTTPGVALAQLHTNAGLSGATADYQLNSTMLWQYTPDGFIESLVTPGLVLSLGPIVNDIYTVTVYPKQPWNNAFQQWYVTSEVMTIGEYEYNVLKLFNPGNGQVLATSGDQIITQWSPPDNSEQDWINVCGYPLEAIMTQPPYPYPTYAPGSPEEAAYAYISENVTPKAIPVPPGIRGQYDSLDSDSEYPTAVLGMESDAPPPGTDASVWPSMPKEICAEMANVQDVQALYGDVTTFLGKLQDSDGIEINALADAVGAGCMSANAKVNYANNVQGTILAMVELVPDVGGCVATLMQTGLNDLVATRQLEYKSELLAVAELNDELLYTYEALSSNFAIQVTAIINDKGKAAAVARLMTLPPSHPDSLAWTDETTPAAQYPAVYGYQVSVMQMLLPAVYQIFTEWNIPNGQDVSSVWFEDAGFPPSGVYEQVWLPYGSVYNFFAIGQGHWTGTTPYPTAWAPPDTLQEYVWNRGQLPSNVYLAQGGWSNFGILAGLTGADGYGDAALLTTIVNTTPNTLDVQVTPNHHDPFSWDSDTQQLGPYASIAFALNLPDISHKAIISGYVTITVSGSQVAYFEVNGHPSNPYVGEVSCSEGWSVHTGFWADSSGDTPAYLTGQVRQDV